MWYQPLPNSLAPVLPWHHWLHSMLLSYLYCCSLNLPLLILLVPFTSSPLIYPYLHRLSFTGYYSPPIAFTSCKYYRISFFINTKFIILWTSINPLPLETRITPSTMFFHHESLKTFLPFSCSLIVSPRIPLMSSIAHTLDTSLTLFKTLSKSLQKLFLFFIIFGRANSVTALYLALLSKTAALSLAFGSVVPVPTMIPLILHHFQYLCLSQVEQLRFTVSKDIFHVISSSIPIITCTIL